MACAVLRPVHDAASSMDNVHIILLDVMPADAEAHATTPQHMRVPHGHKKTTAFTPWHGPVVQCCIHTVRVTRSRSHGFAAQTQAWPLVRLLLLQRLLVLLHLLLGSRFQRPRHRAVTTPTPTAAACVHSVCFRQAPPARASLLAWCWCCCWCWCECGCSYGFSYWHLEA